MMKRVMCAWLPNWPIQRLFVLQPELRGQAVVLHRPRGQGSSEITACSSRAAGWGIRPSVPLAEAVALAESVASPSETQLRQFDHDPQADREGLEQLAHWALRFAPWVGIEETGPPDSLLFDLTGCDRLYPDRLQLLDQVEQAFQRKGYQIRAAIAETIGVAWALAHHGRNDEGAPAIQSLSEAPVEALRLSLECVSRLRSLGLRSVGQLLAAPRAELPARFGKQLLERLDQATGRMEESFSPCRPPEMLEAACEFHSPTDRLDSVNAALRQVVEQLAGELEQRGQGALRLCCGLDHEGTEPSRFSIGLLRPTADPRRLLELAKAELERFLRLAPTTRREPIHAVRVEVSAQEPLESRQREFLVQEPGREAERSAAALVERLTSRLGRQCVLRPRLVADAQPELAWRGEPLIEPEKPSRGRESFVAVFPPGFRPARLLPRPIPLEVIASSDEPRLIRLFGRDHQAADFRGPERIETGWWRPVPVGRDYYRVELAGGCRLWVFRRLRDARWFLHGWFD
ncbi:MAG: DNA polymerase Y family protein [Planctomycetales bacterium]